MYMVYWVGNPLTAHCDAGGEGALKEYRAMPDSSSVVERMEHNVSEFTKHVGCLDINLYDVSTDQLVG